MNLLCDGNFSYADLSKVNELFEIEKEAFPTPWEKRQFESEIKSDTSHTLLLTNDDEIMGFIIFWVIVDEIHIVDLAVRKKYRRQGIAKQLINKVIETWKEKCLTIWLEVRPSNEISLTLYKSLNFVHVMTRKEYYIDTNEDALILSKSLKENQNV